MVHAALGLALAFYGARQFRLYRGYSLELSLAALGVQLAGVVVLLSA